MADTLTPAERSERMSRVRGRHTAPEMLVRRVVHALGYPFIASTGENCRVVLI
jgi:DNA mismatch endonuclease (patch repair protein)